MVESADPDCFWFPWKFECQEAIKENETDPTDPTDPTNPEDTNQVDDATKTAILDSIAPAVDPMTGNIVMLGTAIAHTVVPIMQQFRWRADSGG